VFDQGFDRRFRELAENPMAIFFAVQEGYHRGEARAASLHQHKRHMLLKASIQGPMVDETYWKRHLLLKADGISGPPFLARSRIILLSW
jgi:hypothetical protein